MQKSVHTVEYARLTAELRQARLAAGMSQRDLAKVLEVPHTWVAKVEGGERRIDVVECVWFFAACRVEPLDAITRILGRKVIPSRRRTSTGVQS